MNFRKFIVVLFVLVSIVSTVSARGRGETKKAPAKTGME